MLCRADITDEARPMQEVTVYKLHDVINDVIRTQTHNIGEHYVKTIIIFWTKTASKEAFWKKLWTDRTTDRQ